MKQNLLQKHWDEFLPRLWWSLEGVEKLTTWKPKHVMDSIGCDWKPGGKSATGIPASIMQTNYKPVLKLTFRRGNIPHRNPTCKKLLLLVNRKHLPFQSSYILLLSQDHPFAWLSVLLVYTPFLSSQAVLVHQACGNLNKTPKSIKTYASTYATLWHLKVS